MKERISSRYSRCSAPTVSLKMRHGRLLFASFEAACRTKRPFTKDLGYGKGLILTLLYVRLAINLGRSHRIPLLFCGKVDLLDMVTLHQLEEEGLVEEPKFIPPPFDDVAALASTLSLGGFTAMLDWERLEADYIGADLTKGERCRSPFLVSSVRGQRSRSDIRPTVPRTLRRIRGRREQSPDYPSGCLGRRRHLDGFHPTRFGMPPGMQPPLIRLLD